jgi:hypothetical protein
MTLFEIQKQAKTDKEEASKKIVSFIKEKFSNTEIDDIRSLEINSSAVSVNSVNGFIKIEFDDFDPFLHLHYLHYVSGQIEPKKAEYFFKFHAEENEEETVNEYYQSSILVKNGFPVLEPIFISTEPGEQFLIYDRVKDPTFYDVCESLDAKFLNLDTSPNEKSCDIESTELKDEYSVDKVLGLEADFCELMYSVFEKTKKEASSEVVKNEVVWQLFHHRLHGENPRVDIFYKDKNVNLPNANSVSFEKLKDLKWEINGVAFQESIGELIEASKKIVNPDAREHWTVCVAHGDDHNGNKFYRVGRNELEYFDPAFAGENTPITLASVKTTFHDVFAHPFYFYSDKTILDLLELDVVIENDTIKVTHNFDIEKIAPHRVELLKVKLNKLWKPILQNIPSVEIEAELEFIKKALFCCPFLCKNLIDEKNFAPQSSILALAIAVQMGSYAENKSDNLIDKLFYELCIG